MYEIGNHLLICVGYSDPELHSHSAAHIMISLDEKIEIITEEEKKTCKGVLIPTGMVHTADTDKNRVLVFLFDSTTSVANQIKELTILSDEVVDEIVNAYSCFEESDQSYFSYRKFIRCVYECTGIKMNENMAMDKRIEYALTYIQSNLQEYETVGFASGIDFGKFYREIEAFAKDNLPEKKKVFFLYTCAMERKGFTDSMKEIALEKEDTILGEYGCKGYNTYGPWKVVGGMNKKHPTEAEILSAVEFFEKIIMEK